MLSLVTVGLAGGCKDKTGSGEAVVAPPRDASAGSGEEAALTGAPPVASGLPAGPSPVPLPVLDAELRRSLAAARAFITLGKDGGRAIGGLTPGPTPYAGRALAEPESLEAALAQVAPATSADVEAAAKVAAEAKARAARCSKDDSEELAGLVGDAKPVKPDAKPSGAKGGEGAAVKLAITPRVVAKLDRGGAADVVLLADAAGPAGRVISSIAALNGRGTTLAVAGDGALGAVSYRLAAVLEGEWKYARMQLALDGAAIYLDSRAGAEALPLVDGKVPRRALKAALQASSRARLDAVAVALARDVTVQQLAELLDALSWSGISTIRLVARPEGTLDALVAPAALSMMLLDEACL